MKKPKTSAVPKRVQGRSGRFVVSWDFKPESGGAFQPGSIDADTESCVALRLRLRNEHNELQDIGFAMEPPDDTPEAIAEELVANKIIRTVDCGEGESRSRVF